MKWLALALLAVACGGRVEEENTQPRPVGTARADARMPPLKRELEHVAGDAGAAGDAP